MITVRTVNIEDIDIGARFRRDLGDIDFLMGSIQTFGLICLPVVSKDLILIKGRRRIEACKRLGYKKIRVQIYEKPKES